MNFRRVIMPLPVIVTLLLSVALPVPVQAKSEIYTNLRGIAIKGYDPVAFHTEGRSVEGSSRFELDWKGATWWFSSNENRELFKADPEKYAPRYGGYCAWAVSQGTTAGVDPQNAWSIVDGKLYLNYNMEIKQRWEADIPGNIEKGDANWPGVLK